MDIKWYATTDSDDGKTWLFPVVNAGVIVRHQTENYGDGDASGSRSSESMVFIPGAMIERVGVLGLVRGVGIGQGDMVGRVVAADVDAKVELTGG